MMWHANGMAGWQFLMVVYPLMFAGLLTFGLIWAFNTMRPRIDAPQRLLADRYARGELTDEDTLLTVTAPGVLGNDADVDADGLTAVLDVDTAHGTLVTLP